jgi:hypothetical protein
LTATILRCAKQSTSARADGRSSSTAIAHQLANLLHSGRIVDEVEHRVDAGGMRCSDLPVYVIAVVYYELF